MTVDQMSEIFEKQLTDICVKHTPERTGNEKRTDIPRNRLVLIRKGKKTQSKINYMKYVNPPKSQRKLDKQIKKKQDIEIAIKELIKEELFQKEIQAIQKMKRNPKYFYSYVKKFNKTESWIGPLQDEHENLHSNPDIKANLLQDQYIKVFSDPTKRKNNKVYESKTDAEINDIIITAKDILDAIKDIPMFAAPGPDKLPAIVLKECSLQLVEAIIIIWRKSLDMGKVPDHLKLQTIIPLFKKGSKAMPENYRPVSLTSHLIKLFERVLRKKLITFIEENNLLSKNQHAFRAGRSCLSQLLEHIEYVLLALVNNKNIDVVYLDFAKAFDKVDHAILMKKIEQFGIKGKLYEWIKNFLAGRHQQVLVDNHLSRKEEVLSGVPQGTVLGPLLFLIYINDLEEATKNSILRIFADDSKLVKEIKEKSDHDELQKDLESAINWANENNMELNKDKFQLMQYGRNEGMKEHYKISDDTMLNKEKHVKDLGVHVTDDASWSKQQTEAIKKGRKFMTWILRSFTSRAPEVILTLYQAYVVPRLEYASILWNPYMIGDIQQLESIQRTITAKLDGCEGLNYHQRLHKLKLYSMQRRRERFQAIYMFKIAQGLVPNNMNFQFYTTSRGGQMCRYPNMIGVMPSHFSTVLKNYFSYTGPVIFNKLPANLKEAESLECFKRQLDNYLKKVPDLPPTPGYAAINNNTLLAWATGNYDYEHVKSTLVHPERGSAAEPDRSC